MDAVPLLEVMQLTKTFGGVRALDHVNLTVNSGETIGLIGPNGAGKTTLFNCITGAYRATEGSVRFLGEELVGHSPESICRKGIVRTYQNVRPFRQLTAVQNVLVPLVNRNGADRRLAAARVEALGILEVVGLADKAEVETHRLSLFERKQVELARALGSGARVVLLDEVMAGLNASESETAIQLLRRLRRDRALTIVAIEHIMRIIMAVSDRVVALDQGRVIAIGTPAEVANDPLVKAAYLGDEIA